MTIAQSGQHRGNISIEELRRSQLDAWYGCIVDVPVELIKPDPQNLRQEFDSGDIADLGQNIQSIGQLDEVTIFPVIGLDNEWEGFFDLHDGERRWRAAQAVGLSTLRAKIVPRPSNEELLFKKVSRVLQTRSLAPETKISGLEQVFDELGILNSPELWEDYRKQLGGGPDWPQLTRVLLLKPRVRRFFEEGSINFTIAQSVGRLPENKQEDAAEFVILHKLNGRFFSTQMVPYLIANPEANFAQAFEQARVGGWQNNTKTPYNKGQEPPLDERVETFLTECVKWERAWEVVVHTGLVHQIAGNDEYVYRVKDAARRIADRANALAERITKGQTSGRSDGDLLNALPLQDYGAQLAEGDLPSYDPREMVVSDGPP